MGLLRKASRRKSIFITLLFSYLAILLLPVTAGIYLYHQVEKIMVDHANKTNLGLLEQIKLVAEERFKEIDRMSVQLAFNPKLQWALNHVETDHIKNEFDLAEIIKDFQNVTKERSAIYDFMVYFKNTDTLLTSSGKSDVSFYFNKILRYNEKDADWVEANLFAGSRLKTYFPVTNIKEGERVSPVITYVQSLPIGEQTNPKGYLVAFIHEQEFDRYFQQIEKVNDSSISIIDNNGQVILSTPREHAGSPDVWSLLRDKDGYHSFQENGEAMLVSSTTGENGWKYVSMVPMQSVLQQVNLVKSLALMLLLLILIAGLIASYTLAYRNYSPIREVVRIIMQENTQKRADAENEYEYIQHSIVRSLGEKNQMRQTLMQHLPVIHANFLSRLIKGHMDVTALTEETLTFMGLRFEYDAFGVFLLEIEDCRDFIQKDTEREWADVRVLLTNLCRDLLGKHGYIAELDRTRLAVLVDVGPATDPGHPNGTGFAEQLQEAAYQRYNLKLSIAISQVHRGLEEIGRCYREALIALDYRMIQGSHAVIYHRDLTGLEPHSYYYPLEDEVQLMNFLKSGDDASAVRLLDHIYEANFQSHAISPEMGKFLLIDLLSTIVKVVNGMQLTDQKRFGSFLDPVKVMAECATAEEMIQKTKQISRQICAFVREERTEHGDRFYGKICGYIDEHYADNGLSLASMAEHFDVSLQYLSTFFKKHSGENITDYIAAVRIREAKRMLANPALTMGDIALKIGYANAVSFVRFFKKVEGVPPGKYRDMQEP